MYCSSVSISWHKWLLKHHPQAEGRGYFQKYTYNPAKVKIAKKNCLIAEICKILTLSNEIFEIKIRESHDTYSWCKISSKGKNLWFFFSISEMNNLMEDLRYVFSSEILFLSNTFQFAYLLFFPCIFHWQELVQHFFKKSHLFSSLLTTLISFSLFSFGCNSKVLVISFKSLHGIVPGYLLRDCHSLRISTCLTRSDKEVTLQVHSLKSCHLARPWKCAFPMAVPPWWNYFQKPEVLVLT